MDESLIILIVLSLCLGAGCWLIFIWAVKRESLKMWRSRNTGCWMTIDVAPGMKLGYFGMIELQFS